MLCRTLAGNNVDLLTISSGAHNPKAVKLKPVVVLTGRVHPGESNASYMMQGVVDYLTGPSAIAKLLRDMHCFHVVPMLNPDGVVNGNYRCNLSGHDLNRQWLAPDPFLHPEIHSLKKLMQGWAKEGRLVLFLDLHGHSNRRSIFLYCCDPAVSDLPTLIARRSLSFSLESCTYKVAKRKLNTGRAVVYKELQCVNSFTCEASFLGSLSLILYI